MSFKIMANFVSSCGRIDVFINVSSSQTRTNGSKSIRSNARNISPLKVKLSATYTCEWERVIKFELAQQEEMFCNKGTCEFSQELWTVSRLLLISSIRLEADRTGQDNNLTTERQYIQWWNSSQHIQDVCEVKSRHFKTQSIYLIRKKNGLLFKNVSRRCSPRHTCSTH